MLTKEPAMQSTPKNNGASYQLTNLLRPFDQFQNYANKTNRTILNTLNQSTSILTMNLDDKSQKNKKKTTPTLEMINSSESQVDKKDEDIATREKEILVDINRYMNTIKIVTEEHPSGITMFKLAKEKNTSFSSFTNLDQIRDFYRNHLFHLVENESNRNFLVEQTLRHIFHQSGIDTVASRLLSFNPGGLDAKGVLLLDPQKTSTITPFAEGISIDERVNVPSGLDLTTRQVLSPDGGVASAICRSTFSCSSIAAPPKLNVNFDEISVTLNIPNTLLEQNIKATLKKGREFDVHPSLLLDISKPRVKQNKPALSPEAQVAQIKIDVSNIKSNPSIAKELKENLHKLAEQIIKVAERKYKPGQAGDASINKEKLQALLNIYDAIFTAASEKSADTLTKAIEAINDNSLILNEYTATNFSAFTPKFLQKEEGGTTSAKLVSALKNTLETMGKSLEETPTHTTRQFR
jgi:hypothetical protein